MTELPDGYYEVEKTKKKINDDLPIHIAVFILNYAKLRMTFSDINLLFTGRKHSNVIFAQQDCKKR